MANAVVHHFKYGVWCTIYFICVPPYTIIVIYPSVMVLENWMVGSS